MKPESPTQKGGFDAPASSRERDHLNRWPFAQEIYGIATAGPTDWSVRIGIYGEWGSGKTSVLDFIEALAEPDGHLVVRFNPWEFLDSRTLWDSFISSIDIKFKQCLPQWSYTRNRWKRGARKLKSWWGRFSGIGNQIKSALDEQRIRLPIVGMELLKEFCAFTRHDLELLLRSAYGVRVLILVDDLDRTSSAVVPEMLFAFKELMDIPGVAFVCAFDPKVVGEVLKDRHPGFGDGLKFLEKIIDYPRWLPVPTTEGLMNLALADAKESCSYIPETALRDAVPLLPTNPRAVRQFIRMLTLLRPQIDRHYLSELRWPAILAANVLKVRYPRLAHPLLSDEGFWEGIQTIGLMGSKGASELEETITKHVDKVVATEHADLETKDRKQVEEAVKALCSQISVWSGFDSTALAYQMNVAEAPHAVTWKEFDAFLVQWAEKPTVATANAWFLEHAKKVGRLYLEVYRESIDAAIRRYGEALQSAENVMVNAERPAEFVKAESVFALVECLTSQLGRVEESDKHFDAQRFGALLKQFASHADRTTTATYESFRAKEAALLMALVRAWAPDSGPLVRVLQPFYPRMMRDMESSAAKFLHKQLCAEVLPKFARQVLGRFRETGFASHIIHNRQEGDEALTVLLNVNGPLWKDARMESLNFFRSESRNDVVRENVFELLHWMDNKLREESQVEEAKSLKALLSDAEIVTALWGALTSTRLSPRAVAWLREFPGRLAELGTTVALPDWWNETLATLGLLKEASPAEDGGNS
jgi:predicted 3-demethylubiquinone-9 3-methyltransferase (glyoxalase superfamily)